jgi:Ca2+-binding EF-hand superfamily protein
MQEKGLSKQQLFEDLDSNNNQYVDIEEMQAYFKDRQCVPGITEQQIASLFKFLDANGDDAISVNELCMLL